MNNTLKTSFTLLVLATGFALPSMHAQDTTAPAAPSPSTATDSGTAATPTPKASRHRADPLADLNLTADQKTKVEAIHKDERTALSALRGDTTSADADKKAKRKEIFESHQAQIRALLTPDQQTKFDALPKPGTHAGKAKTDKTAN